MNRTELARIHIAKNELGMDDETYRAMLQNVAGVASSKDLTEAGFKKLMAHFKRCGWKPKAKPGKPSVGRSKQALISKVEALLTEAKLPWAYADAMAKRMYGIEQTGWLEPEQLQGIVAALTYDAKRKRRPTQ